MLDALDDEAWRLQDTESLLDRAKAFHEAGLQETSLAVLDVVEQRCMQATEDNSLLMRFVQQQRQEKADIRQHPKALNNQAVEQYQRGDVVSALDTLRQAFRVMPKNPAIAVNLLQVIVANKKSTPVTDTTFDEVVMACQRLIESSELNDEQRRRYARLKPLLTPL